MKVFISFFKIIINGLLHKEIFYSTYINFQLGLEVKNLMFSDMIYEFQSHCRGIIYTIEHSLKVHDK